MLTIWKFTIEPGDIAVIPMPLDAKILRVGAQDMTACIWAEVHDDRAMVVRRFRVAGTGHDLRRGVNYGEELTYIGSFSLPGPLEFHVLEITKELF